MKTKTRPTNINNSCHQISDWLRQHVDFEPFPCWWRSIAVLLSIYSSISIFFFLLIRFIIFILFQFDFLPSHSWNILFFLYLLLQYFHLAFIFHFIVWQVCSKNQKVYSFWLHLNFFLSLFLCFWFFTWSPLLPSLPFILCCFITSFSFHFHIENQMNSIPVR